MKKIYLLFYYIFFQRIPMYPFPGHILGYTLRRYIVGKVFKSCGKRVVVKDHCYFGDGSRISLGDYSQLGQNSKLLGEIEIGANCIMGPDVVIMAIFHNYSDPTIPIRLQGAGEKPVKIGDDVWLGTRVIILPGINLGDHCVVGAGAVVTKSFPAFSVLAGVPAKVVKMRNE